MRSYRNLLQATGAGLLINLPDLLIVGTSLSALTGAARILCAAMGLVHCLLALGACGFALDHDNFLGAAALAGIETAKALGLCLMCGGQGTAGAALTLTAIMLQCLALKASVDGMTNPLAAPRLRPPPLDCHDFVR
jgi:hypothetical protein